MTTDINALVERLKAQDSCFNISPDLADRAADALTAQSQEIDRLRAALEQIAAADVPLRPSGLHWIEHLQAHIRTLRRMARDALAGTAGDGWRAIEEAPKDRTRILAALHRDLSARLNRPDLESWNGVQIPLRHPGLLEDGYDMGWTVSAPAGISGIPDIWIAAWRPLPTPPAQEDGQ